MRLSIRGSCFSVIILGMLGAAGCQLEYPIDVKLNWSLKPKQLKWYENSGSAKRRKLNVQVKPSPSDASLAVAVVLKEDLDATREKLNKGEEPPKYLAHHPGGGKVDLTFVIDANTPFAVVVRNMSEDETADAEVTIHSK